MAGVFGDGDGEIEGVSNVVLVRGLEDGRRVNGRSNGLVVVEKTVKKGLS
jgi:hypothetical protein